MGSECEPNAPLRSADSESPFSGISSHWPIAAPASGIAILLTAGFWVFARSYDDAFITYRYAANLHAGRGAVFNPGEAVEGYSSPLYMVLTSLLMSLPGDPLFRAKLLGLLSASLTVIVVWRLAGRLALPEWARASVPILLGACVTVAASAVDGMETSLQMLLVTLATLTFIRECQDGLGSVSAIWFLAAALNRAEGIALFVVAAAVRLWALRKAGGRRQTTVWFVAVAAPYVGFVLWRHWYYREWFTNTVIAKTQPLLAALGPGMGPSYLLRTIFVDTQGGLWVLGLGALLWCGVLAGAVSERIPRARAQVIPALVAAQSLVALRAGGDWMQGWRYMMPIAPLWVILLVSGVADFSRAAGGAGRSRLVGLAVVAGLLVLCAVAGTGFRDRGYGGFSWAEQGWATDSRRLLHGYDMENKLIIADYLRAHVPTHSTIAYGEVGATPFYTPSLQYIDTYGLTDREIARLDSPNRTRWGIREAYTSEETLTGRILMRRRPDYILAWIHDESYPSAILDSAYVPDARVPLKQYMRPNPVFLQIWRREDLRDSAAAGHNASR